MIKNLPFCELKIESQNDLAWKGPYRSASSSAMGKDPTHTSAWTEEK